MGRIRKGNEQRERLPLRIINAMRIVWARMRAAQFVVIALSQVKLFVGEFYN